MSIRDLIRISIIKTNSLWPFTFLNRIPYHLALKSFIYTFSSFREIKSIYLRHGMSKKNWVPAVSDIDLTVIIYGDLSNEREYNFLKAFWKKFKRLKKIFPMLGEIDILNENEIASWTKFTVRGYEAGGWKLLYGNENIKSSYKIDENILAIDSINYAFTNYLEYFLPKFYSNNDNDFIVFTELSRLTSKISRYTNPALDPKKIKLNQSGSKRRAELLYNVIKTFELSVDNIKQTAFQGNNDSSHLELSANANNQFGFEPKEIDLYGLNGCLDKIDAFIISYTTRVIVLKDEISPEEMVDCIDIIRNVFTAHTIKPIILNLALFEYYLRIFNPFIYSQLLDGRKVLFGNDLFLKVRQPDHYFYIKSIVDETGNILLFPQSSSLFNRNTIKGYVQNGFNSKANRGLFLKLYLEKSVIETRFNQFIEECKKLYPQYFQQINYLTSNYENISEDQLSFETYKLLKALSSEIK